MWHPLSSVRTVTHPQLRVRLSPTNCRGKRKGRALHFYFITKSRALHSGWCWTQKWACRSHTVFSRCVKLWFPSGRCEGDAAPLTWAERKRCRSSWPNSGRPGAGCSSSAPTDPAYKACQCVSAQRPNGVRAKLMRLGLDILLWCRSCSGKRTKGRLPYDQSQLHSSRRSIQIWSHLDSWIGSVDKAR